MLNKILDFRIFTILAVVFLITSCSSKVEKDMKVGPAGPKMQKGVRTTK